MLVRKALTVFVGTLLMIGLFLPVVTHADGKLKVQYDEVRDITTVDTGVEWLKKSMLGDRKTGYDALYGYAGKVPSRSPKVCLYFLAQRLMRDSPTWENEGEIAFKYGDTRNSYPAAYERKVKKNFIGVPSGYVEHLICYIPTKEFVAMSQVKEILLAIGNKTLVIEKADLDRLVLLAKSLPPE